MATHWQDLCQPPRNRGFTHRTGTADDNDRVLLTLSLTLSWRILVLDFLQVLPSSAHRAKESKIVTSRLVAPPLPAAPVTPELRLMIPKALLEWRNETYPSKWKPVILLGVLFPLAVICFRRYISLRSTIARCTNTTRACVHPLPYL